MDLFEANDITWQGLAKQLKAMLESLGSHPRFYIMSKMREPTWGP